MLSGLFVQGMGGKSLLLLATTIGAWWMISRELSRPKTRKSRNPLFKRQHGQIDKEEEEETDDETKKTKRFDERGDLTDFSPVKKPANSESLEEGEGCPPDSTPSTPITKSSKKPEVDDRSAGKGATPVSSSKRQIPMNKSKDGQNEVKGIDAGKHLQTPARKLLIRTPTHETHIIRTERQNAKKKPAEAQRDSDVFFGLLQLYSGKAGKPTPQPKPSPKNGETMIISRESLEQAEAPEGDPFYEASPVDPTPKRVDRALSAGAAQSIRRTLFERQKQTKQSLP